MRWFALLLMCLIAQELPAHAQGQFWPTPNNGGSVAGFVPLCITAAGSDVGAGYAVPCGTHGTGYATPVITTPCSSALTLTPGNAYDVTLNGNCVLTFGTASGGSLQSIFLDLRQGGSGGYTPTLPSGVKWPGGTAPTPNSTAGKIDVFSFRTPDAGVTWFGGN